MEYGIRQNSINANLIKIENRNITLLLLGKLVSLLGSSIYGFAISLYILKVTGSGLSFSFSLALSTLPRVLFGPLSGVVADRLDRKKMIVGLDILSGIIVLSIFVISMYSSLELRYIYITTFLLSTCSTFFNTPLTASLPKLVREESLTRINSLSEAIGSIATIAGPFAGGIVFALIDIKLFLLINGLSFIISGISENFIDFEFKDKNSSVKENKEKKKINFVEDLKEGFRYMLKEKWILILASLAIFFNLFIMIGLTVPVPYIVTNVWKFSSKQYGLLNGMFPAGMLIASLILSALPEKKKNFKRLIVGILIFSIVIFMVGIITSEIFFSFNNTVNLILLMICYIAMAFASIFINVPVMVTMQKKVPSDMLGRVYGTLGTISMGLSPLGAIIGGILVDKGNPWMLPMVCGLLMVVFTFIASLNKELRQI